NFVASKVTRRLMTTIFGKKGHPETPDALFRRENGRHETRVDHFRGEIAPQNPNPGNFFAILVAMRRISPAFSLHPTPESNPTSAAPKKPIPEQVFDNLFVRKGRPIIPRPRIPSSPLGP
ncbi:MAG: hypothetical protein JWM68_5172, partial [Verrucomicrobiales bacterium]|nr:hypothetical protein [Verrucomicrobiales bacterium]